MDESLKATEPYKYENNEVFVSLILFIASSRNAHDYPHHLTLV